MRSFFPILFCHLWGKLLWVSVSDPVQGSGAKAIEQTGSLWCQRWDHPTLSCCPIPKYQCSLQCLIHHHQIYISCRDSKKVSVWDRKYRYYREVQFMLNTVWLPSDYLLSYFYPFKSNAHLFFVLLLLKDNHTISTVWHWVYRTSDQHFTLYQLELPPWWQLSLYAGSTTASVRILVNEQLQWLRLGRSLPQQHTTAVSSCV